MYKTVFSDEKEIVLNQILVACKRSRDRCRQAAQLAGDDRLSRLLEGLAAGRRDMADALEGMLKASGFLPAEPDPDRQSVAELATRLKAAVSRDDRMTLLQTASDREDDLETALARALAMPWPDGIVRQLQQFDARLQTDRLRLSSYRASLANQPGKSAEDGD